MINFGIFALFSLLQCDYMKRMISELLFCTQKQMQL